MVSFILKAVLALSLIHGAAGAHVGQEVCLDAWAYEEEHDICAKTVGAKYWGWTNGRYGTSGCDACDCPDCPTEPPSPESPPSKAPTPTPVPLPKKCIGISGQWSGDPHFKTFDGLDYDCQGEGEFHVLKSKESNFAIQGRFVKFQANKRPTVTKSLVWELDEGDPLIQVTVPDHPVDGMCLPFVHVAKTLVADPDASQWLTDDVQIEFTKTGKLEGYIFYHHSSGVQVTVMGKKSSANGCVISAKFCLPDTWSRSTETFMGLLGNADGDKWNDWMDINNAPVSVPRTEADRKFDVAYGWCSQWCIAKEPESLFAYDQSKQESYAGFAQYCNQTFDQETKDCCLNPDADLAEVCGLGDYACLVDGCAGGVEEAKDYLTTEASLAEKDCGKEIAAFDFSQADAVNWGDIMHIDSNPFLAFSKDGNQSISHIFQVSAAADLIEIEFKFIESGGWEAAWNDNRQRYIDSVKLSIEGVELDLLGFDKAVTPGNPEEYFTGAKQGIVWERRATTEPGQDFGLKGSRHGHDQMHKVTVKIPSRYYENGSLNFKFEAHVTSGDEIAGVDDFRIIEYGQTCDIPADPDVKGDEGRKFNAGCGEQIYFQDFQDVDGQDKQDWGTIETVGENSYLRMDDESKLWLSLEQLPHTVDTFVIEFDMYALGNWNVCESSDKCDQNRLIVQVGNKKIVDMDLHEIATNTVNTDERHSVEWMRNSVVPGVIHVSMHVPSEHLDGGNFEVELSLDLPEKSSKATDMAVGFDDLRITTYADGCIRGEEKRGRRKLAEFMERKMKSKALSTEQSVRHLTAAVETDQCTCLCPALPDEGPGEPDTPTAPKVMDLYTRADKITCDPVGDSIGTVTMTLTPAGMVQFEYTIYGKYTLKETAVYVGEERLPYRLETSEFLPPSDFPYLDDQASGTTATVLADPLVCDYHAAAYAKVCGPTESPTSGPTGPPTSTPITGSPTGSPTSGPTGPPTSTPITGSPTGSPTSGPTGPPTSTPRTGSPTEPPTGSPTSEPEPQPETPRTPAPVTMPPKTPAPTGASVSGDPHVVTWGGKKFDFHGGCDLVLLDNPSFHNGVGMTVHIRTKIVDWWSYIETAVVRIGNETLEVTGGENHRYMINGVVGDNKAKDFTFSSIGLKVYLKQASAIQLKVRIDLLNADALGFEVFKDFVRVNVKMKDMKWKKFEGSVGLMGSYPHGIPTGRDGKTVYTDLNAFGQEWQVHESEPKLFHTVDGPQHPTKCMMPSEVSTEEKRRRLGGSMITRDDAELACAHVGDQSRDACIFDVVATNDLDMAGSY